MSTIHILGSNMLKDLGRTNKLGGKLKNSGGSNEPMGSAVEDGKIEPDIGMLTKLKDNKLGGKLKNSGSAQEKFNGNGVAPMKGLGESLWNPSDISKLIGEGEINLANAFNIYARSADTLCLSDFNNLLESYGTESRVDADGFRLLMNENQDYFFFEHDGAVGSVYLKESVTTNAVADGVPVALGDEPNDEPNDESNDEFGEDLNEDFGAGPAGPMARPRPRPLSTGNPMAGARHGGPAHGPVGYTQRGQLSQNPMAGPGLGGGLGGGMDIGEPGLGGGAGDMSGFDDGMSGGGDLGNYEDPMAVDASAETFGDENLQDDGFEDNPMGLTADKMPEPMYGAAQDQNDNPWFESVQNIIGRDMVAEDILGRTARIVVTSDPNKVSEFCAKHRSNLGDANVAAIYMENAPLKIALDGMNNVVAVAGTTIGVFDTRDNRLYSKQLDETFGAVPDEDGEYTFVEEACEKCNKDDCECEVVGEDCQNGGSNTTEMGEPLGRKIKNSGSSQEDAGESKHGDAADGITTELKPNKLGGKLKNSGSAMEKFHGGGDVAPMKGGASEMKENASKLLRSFKPIVESYQRRHQKAKPYYIAFVEGVKTAVRGSLSESVLDLEELAQVYGENKVNLVVKFYEGNNGVGTYKIPTARTVRSRGPVVAEGKAIFRTINVAKKFASVLVSEGKIVKVASHNWGASVSAKVSYYAAEQIFSRLCEDWGPDGKPKLRGSSGVTIPDRPDIDDNHERMLRRRAELDGAAPAPRKTCGGCNGTGTDPETKIPFRCKACKGTGKIIGSRPGNSNG